MSDSYILSEKEIINILNSVEKENHLELYKNLKKIVFSADISKKDLNEFKKNIISLYKEKNLPRLLTEKELNDIVEVIPSSPATLEIISVDIRNQIRTFIKKQLSNQKVIVDEETISIIKKNIIDKFYLSSSQAGDSVGVISAMSIGQPLTQANLNTFHNTGSKTTSDAGIKDINRLLNLTSGSDENNNIIHFKDKNKTREEIYNIGKKIKGITINHIIKNNGQKIMEKIPQEDKYWYANYIKVNNLDKEFFRNQIFFRIYLDNAKLYKYDIMIKDVVELIEKNSKTAGFKKTLECVASSSKLSIIDIYTSKDYVSKKMQDYSNKINKDKNLIISGIKDQLHIFFKNILSDEFKKMFLRGIKGVKNFSISEPLHLNSTFEEISVINPRDLKKFSSKPYNLEIKDIDYLWYIKIKKYYIYFMGLNEEKYINLFEEAGMKILENNFKDDEPRLTILMPKNRNVKFFNENKTYEKYTLKNGRYYDNSEKKWSVNYNPKKLIDEKLKYVTDIILFDIEKKLKENIINDTELIFPNIYRYSYYYYSVIAGNNLIFDLYNIPEVDFSYSYPEDILEVNKNFGIESARFILSGKYNSGANMKNINPNNIELLIDYQTAYGFPLSVSAKTLGKQGNSILTSASYESSLDYLKNGSTVGEIDKIKGISSCIMTGSKSRNGTGIVRSSFSKEYLENKDNLISEESQDVEDYQFDNSLIKGVCYKAAVEDMVIDGIKENVEETDLLDPPRMEKNGIIDDLLNLDNILYSQDKEIDDEVENENDDIYLNLDIPDAPEEEYSEDLL